MAFMLQRLNFTTSQPTILTQGLRPGFAAPARVHMARREYGVINSFPWSTSEFCEMKSAVHERSRVWKGQEML
jgi:hypothetical protein